jgi:GTP cyclohydrolase IB
MNQHTHSSDTAHTKKPLIDVQSSSDLREIAIKNVGVKALKLPVSIAFSKKTTIHPLHTIANVDLYVGLAKHVKGTHMSRLLEVFNNQPMPLTFDRLEQLMLDMLTRLEATSGSIYMNATYFIEKTAPVSQVKSLMDYEIGFDIIKQEDKNVEVYLKLLVPVKSLCPCSKKISEYGAHNQRSHIKVKALISQQIDADDLIGKIEKQGSSEIWAVLKREDEKFITEKAYENPKFVEDLVRDVALVLNQQPEVLAYELSAENFESIHNHSAYAEIVMDKRI